MEVEEQLCFSSRHFGTWLDVIFCGIYVVCVCVCACVYVCMRKCAHTNPGSSG